jgi:RHS repeat-associated protein
MTTVTGCSDTNPWRYASGYYDCETEMLKFGTRYYIPKVSRWTQIDPKAGKPQQPLTLNPYVYSAMDPTNISDASGRDWFGDLWEEATFQLEMAGIPITGMSLGTLSIVLGASLGGTGLALGLLAGVPLIVASITTYAVVMSNV